MKSKRPLRKKKLINPRLQLRMVLQFLGLSLLMLAFFYLVLGFRLSSMLETTGLADANLIGHLNRVHIESVLLAALITLPITLAVGILVTFPIAGPLYRFQSFLEAIQRGEQSAPCHIRDGDELHEFCDLLNEVTEPLRAPASQVDEAA